MIEPIPKYVNDLANRTIGAALAVHTEVGPGLSEKAYELCLVEELGYKGINAKRQIYLPVKYKGCEVKAYYKIDLLVDNCLIVEIKTVESLSQIDSDQLLGYLKQSGHRLGLLLNFRTLHMRDGIKRVAL
jgi:GxxExxY protein